MLCEGSYVKWHSNDLQRSYLTFTFRKKIPQCLLNRSWTTQGIKRNVSYCAKIFFMQEFSLRMNNKGFAGWLTHVSLYFRPCLCGCMHFQKYKAVVPGNARICRKSFLCQQIMYFPANTKKSLVFTGYTCIHVNLYRNFHAPWYEDLERKVHFWKPETASPWQLFFSFKIVSILHWRSFYHTHQK